MSLRLGILSLIVCLTPGRETSAAVVRHELSGIVNSSFFLDGVAVNDPFTAVLTYDANHPDLLPADPSSGKYNQFTFSQNVGSVSVSQTNPVNYDFGIIDRPSSALKWKLPSTV